MVHHPQPAGEDGVTDVADASHLAVRHHCSLSAHQPAVSQPQWGRERHWLCLRSGRLRALQAIDAGRARERCGGCSTLCGDGNTHAQQYADTYRYTDGDADDDWYSVAYLDSYRHADRHPVAADGHTDPSARHTDADAPPVYRSTAATCGHSHAGANAHAGRGLHRQRASADRVRERGQAPHIRPRH